MPPNIPIEFLRRLANNVLQHAGNRVQLEDQTGNPYDAGNPLPVQAPPGAILGTVGIDQVTANANHVEDVLLNTVLGTTGGAAVVSDANGTVQQYLRGLVKILADLWNSATHTLGIRLPGLQVALKAATTITTDGTVNSTPVTGLDPYTMTSILLTVSGQTMDASTTLDIYLQYSPDGGTTWDDLYHFTQITTAAYASPRVFFLNIAGAVSQVSRVTTDGTLAVATLREISWCDRMRVKTVAANFAGTDTVTIKLDGYFQ